MYDRIDWTLLLLKEYFDIIQHSTQNDKEEFMMKANGYLEMQFRNKRNFDDKFSEMFEAFQSSRKWFEQFNTFNSFCNQFCLVGSFVDDEYRIIRMTDLFPILPKNYSAYITNICDSVGKRTKLICEQ